MSRLSRPGKLRGEEVPKLIDSHLTASSDGLKKVTSMERYQCNSCHVAQVDAKPLVANTFVGVMAAKK